MPNSSVRLYPVRIDSSTPQLQGFEASSKTNLSVEVSFHMAQMTQSVASIPGQIRGNTVKL